MAFLSGVVNRLLGRKQPLPRDLTFKDERSFVAQKHSCPSCHAHLEAAELEDNLYVCPKCSHHHRIKARVRLDALLDADARYEIGSEVLPTDMLKFKDSKRYRDRLMQAQKATGEKDALVVARGRLKGREIVVAAFEFKFLGGSMGSVVGERFRRAVRIAVQDRIPLVCFSASGGARMQEALFSLMQMAKTSAALARMNGSTRGPALVRTP